MPTHNLYLKIEKCLMIASGMMWLSQKSKPSYKTINRFRVNPKVDALLEILFIQFTVSV